jgi:hypothetical protein
MSPRGEPAIDRGGRWTLEACGCLVLLLAGLRQATPLPQSVQPTSAVCCQRVHYSVKALFAARPCIACQNGSMFARCLDVAFHDDRNATWCRWPMAHLKSCPTPINHPGRCVVYVNGSTGPDLLGIARSPLPRHRYTFIPLPRLASPAQVVVSRLVALGAADGCLCA